MTICRGLGGLKNKHLLSYSSEVWKSQFKVLAGASLLAFQMAAPRTYVRLCLSLW